MLTIQALHKHYDKHHVLKGIDANFEDGQVHGVIGLNGAGKTTFFNCVCGLIYYEGSISHSGEQLLKNTIAYVPTELFFFPRTKGKEYLDLIGHARGVKNINSHVTNTFDLPLNEYIDNYSTGMKRKLAVVGAMIGESDIYILDEPFNGVDIKSNLILKRLVLELKQQGKTVLLSSHIVSSLTELCDKVYMLQEGRFTKTYTPEEYSMIEHDMMEG